LKKLMIIVLALVVLVVVAFIGVSAYLGYSMTRVERVPVTGSPAEYGLAYEEVSFPSLYKDLTLRGWFLPVEGSGRVVIMVHGNGHNRNDPGIGMLDIAAGLVDYGFNVLMFDLHGFGESEGNTVSGGYYEKEDLKGAVAYIQGQGFDSIGVLGFSMGAVSSLLAAAEDTDISAIVADSSYADISDIMEPEFSNRTKAPRLFLRPILFMIKVMFGVDFAAIRPVDTVPEITPRPIFFIHGNADDMIPVDHAERLFAASSKNDNQLWIVPQTGHTQAFKEHPEEFMSRVISFFDESLQ
jgi:dipeptidyl aminopeptidase/acylaminoacyl peptidase